MNAETTSNPTELLILAGGLGTRLRQAICDVPKPMAPVNGVPFLAHLIQHWRRQGIRRFVLSVGYMADSIRSYFGTHYHDCTIDYAFESFPLGTGGAIRNAIVNGAWLDEHLVIINGDTWFPVQLSRLFADANQKEKPVTIAVKHIAENDRYGGVLLDDTGLVRRFIAADPSAKSALINGGTYLINLNYMTEHLLNRLGTFSFERDILENLATKGLLATSTQDVAFLDIGIPDDYLRAGELILRDTMQPPNPH